MRTSFTGDDRILLDRFIESVLLRFSDGKYSLADATEALAQAFTHVANGQPDAPDHMRGVVEAGDDA